MRNKNLENRLKGSNWAYTGSIAMKLHANRLGFPFPLNRKIGNINIAAIDPLAIVPIISKTKNKNNKNRIGWHLNSSPEYKRTKFYSNRGGINMNLFPANGKLAPNFKHVQKFNGYPPIMSLNSLLNQKMKINENNVFGNNIRKLKRNKEILRELIKLNRRVR